MFRRSRHSAFPHRSLLTLVGVIATGAAYPAGGAAAPVRAPLQPDAVVGAATRPSCDSPTAPFDGVDLLNLETDDFESTELTDFEPALAAEAAAATTDGDLQPIATICSPTYAAIPAAFGGTVVASPRRSRVGTGWRELGGSLAEPAQFLPGDVLTVPDVDDAARLRVSVATSQGRPTAIATFTDLSPGPSQVTLSAEPRGLVARLTRADGSAQESIQQQPIVPALAPKISGRPSRWVVTTQHLPGTIVTMSRDDRYGDAALTRAAPTGTATTRLATSASKRKRKYGELTIVASNRAAQVLDVQSCLVRLKASQAPRSMKCEAITTSSLVGDFADEYLLGGQLSAAKAQALLAAAKDVLRDVIPAEPTPSLARTRGQLLATARQEGVPASQPSATRSAATAAPLVATVTSRAPSVTKLRASGIRVLNADINGDGGLDYWTDSWNQYVSSPLRGDAAGVLLVSSPSGLTEHRVDLPVQTFRLQWDSGGSELSAIGDITGDGIGEVVVDLNERHVIIPGSTSWTGSTFPIVAPDLTDLRPEDRVFAFDLSSPGAPLATLDDVDGDGKNELLAADDSNAWMKINAAAMTPGTLAHLPSGARAITPPAILSRLVRADPGVPRVNPATRLIGGQAIALRWPVVATKATPTGTVTIDVQDAAGRSTRPLISVSTPGNALLLDYDRVSGESLLLSASVKCTTITRYRIGGKGCRFTVLRVGPDGRIQQTVGGQPSTSQLTHGSARFMADGPDPDQRVETVIASGIDSAALLESTATGGVKESALPTARLRRMPKRTYSNGPLRFFPVIGTGGSRRLAVPLPTVETERYGREVWYYARSATLSAELRWR